MLAQQAATFSAIQPAARRVLLVIEEYGDIRNRAEAAGTLAEFDAALAQLARRGGKRGFHLLLIDQHYKGSYDTPPWPETVARNVHRLSFHQPQNDTGLVGWWDMQGLEPGQFAYRADRYHAWQAMAEAPRLLANVPRLSGPRILDNVPVIDGSFVRSVAKTPSTMPEMAGNRGGSPTERPKERPTERPPLIGDEARQAIHAHLTTNPKATQAEIRDALKTSKGWTHQCWHEWHAAQKNKPQPPTAPANVWDVMGREVIDLTNEAGADAIRRINWKEVVIK